MSLFGYLHFELNSFWILLTLYKSRVRPWPWPITPILILKNCFLKDYNLFPAKFYLGFCMSYPILDTKAVHKVKTVKIIFKWQNWRMSVCVDTDFVNMPLIDTRCVFEFDLFFEHLNTCLNPKHIMSQLLIHRKHYKHFIITEQFLPKRSVTLLYPSRFGMTPYWMTKISLTSGEGISSTLNTILCWRIR